MTTQSRSPHAVPNLSPREPKHGNNERGERFDVSVDRLEGVPSHTECPVAIGGCRFTQVVCAHSGLPSWSKGAPDGR